MNAYLPLAIRIAGVLQLGVLVASALVPIRLDWRAALAPLPRLLRQLVWVYGGYIVLAIVGLGTLCLVNGPELASGSWLARSVAAYLACFWGIRLVLVGVLDARPY